MTHEKSKLQNELWRKGISQSAAAQRLGITEKQMSLKARGIAPLRWREVVALCELLEIENPLTGVFGDK